MSAEFKRYQQMVIENARAMAKALQRRGLRIVSGGTESHMFLVDLRAKKVTGKEAEAVLGRAHITVNKNAIPRDPQTPFVTSGIRIGTPAVTTRGFAQPQVEQLAELIADVLDAPTEDKVIARVAADVTALCRRFPVYAGELAGAEKPGGIFVRGRSRVTASHESRITRVTHRGPSQSRFPEVPLLRSGRRSGGLARERGGGPHPSPEALPRVRQALHHL
jgi:hypothetical protein